MNSHNFLGLFFCCIFGTAFCSPQNDIVWPWDSKMEALGFHFVPLLDMFLQLLVIRYFFEDRPPVRVRAQKTRLRGHQNCKTWIKSDLAGGPVWGHTFFEKKMPAWMHFNNFLSILGSARGAHRGSNEPCSPVLKTLLGPNGPQNHPKAPKRSPRLKKSPGNVDFLRFLCGVLTSFVILFWHAIPWQRSKHHKTKQKLR